jgi:Matrixin.
MTRTFRRMLLALCTCIAVFSAFASVAMANTFSFDWTHVSSGFVSVAASDDYLNSDWNGTVYSNGRGKWNGSSADIYISDTTFSNSNLDLMGVDEQTWIDNGWSTGLYAWAQPWDGSSACSDDANDDPGVACDEADYGAIYVNEGNTPSGSDFKSAILAHEMGHIVGLAHTTSATSSIMQGSPNSYFSYTVTTYDENELNNKY